MLRRLATLIVTLFLSTAAVAQEAAPDAEELTRLDRPEAARTRRAVL